MSIKPIINDTLIPNILQALRISLKFLREVIGHGLALGSDLSSLSGQALAHKSIRKRGFNIDNPRLVYD
jgi:hypothetical protein